MLTDFFKLDCEEDLKRNYIWNTAAGILNAMLSVILSMAITRISNLTDVGILSIGFAVSNLLVTVGLFGVRNYQVTDMEEKYSFGTYCKVRIFSVGTMITISLGYCVYGFINSGYSLYKTITLFCMCMIYAIEAMEDVFSGLFHKNGRLDIAGKIYIIRWSGILFVYIMTMMMWKNLALSSVLALSTSIVLSGINIWTCRRYYNKIKRSENSIGLIKDCLPLCLSLFLSYYISNSPKYAIDRYLSDDVQACFGFVAMPIAVIALLSSFLYQPTVQKIALEWNEGKIFIIQRRIVKQIIIIAFILILCMCGAYLLGIPVLSLLFGTNLGAYRAELMLLLLGGGSLAIINYLVMILTVMRKQRIILLIYSIFAVSSLILSNIAVRYNGTRGAAGIYMVIMLVMAVVLIGSAMFQINKQKDK